MTHRRSPASTVLYRRARLARDEVSGWCGRTYPELYATLAREGLDPGGPAGATYAGEFFEHDEGEVVAFVPVPPGAVHDGDSRFTVLAEQRFAVTVHSGPFSDCALPYGRLGRHVHEHDVPRPEPIVEIYLIGPDRTTDPNEYQTEICWPIQ